MSNIASVYITNSTRNFDKEYHYQIPDSIKGNVIPGVRVIVPFGKADRSTEGYVLKVMEFSEMKGLKDVKKLVDDKPILSAGMLELALWMKKRYICTFSDAIKCMLPPGIGIKSTKVVRFIQPNGLEELKHSIESNIKKPNNISIIIDKLIENGNEYEYEELKNSLNIKSFSKDIKKLEQKGFISVFEEYSTKVKEKTVRVAFLSLPKEEIIEEIESNRVKKIQQIRVLEMLLENEFISIADIVRFSSVSASVLNTLKKYGYIDFKDIEVNRDPLRQRVISPTQPLEPTSEQLSAINEIKKKIDFEEFGEVLLHGVTGSGKTEVYLQLIQHVIDKEKQSIVLVPEISLTPQMVERFKGRFGTNVAVLHSRLSLGERFDQWRLIKEGKIKVVVGARSAVFAPFQKLGLVIMDEEHENTYKSEITPKYHASDIARERCVYDKAVLLLGSATPSVDTYFKARSGKIDFLEMASRANKMQMPKVEIVDMRKELDEGNRSIFSRKLSEEVDNNISLGQQTMLFLNRRGHASFVFCRKCGFSLKCVNCNISLTYHSNDERLICHYCGYTIKNPELCPNCKSDYIRHFGTGTQRVEDDIKKQFPLSSVIRMDMDTTTYKNSHEEILRTFRDNNINIMVGTQMIAKGHDFPNVTLVGVLAADSLLNTGDYKASERTFQLITQVSGRAGRGELKGRVIVQTYNCEDFSIRAACNHDYTSFYNQEIQIRKKLEYPPFTNLAVMILSGMGDRHVYNKAKEVKILTNEYFGNDNVRLEILGPARAPLSKIKNKYRWRIIVKCHNFDKLLDVLSSVSDSFHRKKEKNEVELSMDINPVNML